MGGTARRASVATRRADAMEIERVRPRRTPRPAVLGVRLQTDRDRRSISILRARRRPHHCWARCEPNPRDHEETRAQRAADRADRVRGIEAAHLSAWILLSRVIAASASGKLAPHRRGPGRWPGVPARKSSRNVAQMSALVTALTGSTGAIGQAPMRSRRSRRRSAAGTSPGAAAV